MQSEAEFLNTKLNTITGKKF